MQHKSRKYLYDIQRAACLLREFTNGTTPHDDEGGTMLRSAVERLFEDIRSVKLVCRPTDGQLWSPR